MVHLLRRRQAESPLSTYFNTLQHSKRQVEVSPKSLAKSLKSAPRLPRHPRSPEADSKAQTLQATRDLAFAPFQHDFSLEMMLQAASLLEMSLNLKEEDRVACRELAGVTPRANVTLADVLGRKETGEGGEPLAPSSFDVLTAALSLLNSCTTEVLQLRLPIWGAEEPDERGVVLHRRAPSWAYALFGHLSALSSTCSSAATTSRLKGLAPKVSSLWSSLCSVSRISVVYVSLLCLVSCALSFFPHFISLPHLL